MDFDRTKAVGWGTTDGGPITVNITAQSGNVNLVVFPPGENRFALLPRRFGEGIEQRLDRSHATNPVLRAEGNMLQINLPSVIGNVGVRIGVPAGSTVNFGTPGDANLFFDGRATMKEGFGRSAEEEVPPLSLSYSAKDSVHSSIYNFNGALNARIDGGLLHARFDGDAQLTAAGGGIVTSGSGTLHIATPAADGNVVVEPFGKLDITVDERNKGKATLMTPPTGEYFSGREVLATFEPGCRYRMEGKEAYLLTAVSKATAQSALRGPGKSAGAAQSANGLDRPVDRTVHRTGRAQETGGQAV